MAYQTHRGDKQRAVELEEVAPFPPPEGLSPEATARWEELRTVASTSTEVLVRHTLESYSKDPALTRSLLACHREEVIKAVEPFVGGSPSLHGMGPNILQFLLSMRPDDVRALGQAVRYLFEHRVSNLTLQECERIRDHAVVFSVMIASEDNRQGDSEKGDVAYPSFPSPRNTGFSG